MRRRRTRTRLRSPVALLAACAVVAGCAGGEEPGPEPPAPRLQAAVAGRLAAHADRVANLLEAGDVCGAAHAADTLQGAVIEAVNAGRVPAAFQEDLAATAAELVDSVNCPPAPTTVTGDEDDEDVEDKGPGKGKGKKKGRGRGG